MEKKLKELIAGITPPDGDAMSAARARQDALAKPPGSLGELEEISIRMAGITGRVCNAPEKKRIIVLCADNGVVEEGVSSAPRSVTAAQAMNMLRRRTGMSSMAKHFGNEVQVVDMGIAEPYNPAGILQRSLGKGTKNFCKGAAMSREQCLQAILTGMELAAEAKRDGIDLIGVGEMGIGNTSSSSAVLCVLTGLSVEEVTGRGGGLTDAAFAKKKDVLRRAIAVNAPDKNDPIDVLSKVGGFDLAAMCGVFLGAARERIGVVIDGFISIVAALCAARLCPAAREYMFPSHASFEIGYMAAAKELGLQPWMALNMRLGEGSGCPIAFEVIGAACAAMSGMALFGEEAAIDDGYLKEIREKDSFSL